MSVAYIEAKPSNWGERKNGRKKRLEKRLKSERRDNHSRSFISRTPDAAAAVCHTHHRLPDSHTRPLPSHTHPIRAHIFPPEARTHHPPSPSNRTLPSAPSSSPAHVRRSPPAPRHSPAHILLDGRHSGLVRLGGGAGADLGEGSGKSRLTVGLSRGRRWIGWGW
jgi:hypothetical protein